MKRRKRKNSSRRGLRAVLLCLAAIIAICAALTVALYASSYGGGFDNSAYRKDAFAGQRVLVLVPHEDDDVAMAGATIRLYVDGGADVHVAFASNGDFSVSADTRVREAVRGLSVLGVPKENIVFLGYGDSWDYTACKHIYHAAGDAPLTSASGRTETFGAGGFADLHATVYQEPAPYTRDNFLLDLHNLLVMLRPDVIFAVDLDSHTDHCGLSWLFEEALGKMLLENADYRPKVYKGYAYSVAWFGAEDFYADNIASSQPPAREIVNDPRYPLDQPGYDWATRVRFPMPREALSYTLRSSVVYRALSRHASQEARFRGENIISGDTVFFERRTDSLTYAPGVAVSASSGDAACLNDFKLADTNNLLDWPVAFDAGIWQTDSGDTERSVTVTLPNKADVASVSLFDDCDPVANILAGTLTFSDGSTVETGPLHPLGQETRVTFPVKRGITSFTFTATAFDGDAPGLTELLAFSPEEAETPAFIKLALDDASETFLYRYTVRCGETQPICVYAPTPADAGYTLQVTSGNGDVTVENGVLHVSEAARPGRHTVTAAIANDPAVFDTVEVVVPSVFETALHRLLSLYERALDRVEYRLLRMVKGD